MWNLFRLIVESYMTDRGILDPHMQIVSVALVNYMVKAPNEFVNANINGKAPLFMTLELIQKIFSMGKEIEDEILSMIGVTLIIALVENVGEAMRPHIHTVNQMFLHELSTAETKDFKNMII
jgi:hypothetical protein